MEIKAGWIRVGRRPGKLEFLTSIVCYLFCAGAVDDQFALEMGPGDLGPHIPLTVVL